MITEDDTTYDMRDFSIIADNMIAYGGSFFKGIGKALKSADWENSNRLYSAFTEEFDRYRTYEETNSYPFADF